jgi:hypothetical protein
MKRIKFKVKPLSDLFSENMTTNSAILKEYFSLLDMGMTEQDAARQIAKKYGLTAAERALSSF